MQSLVDRAREGDGQAEQELFQFLAARFRVVVRQYIRGGEDVEDVAQEACMAVLRKYKTESFTVSFDAWAYGILLNKIKDSLHSSKRRRGQPIPHDAESNMADCAVTTEEPYFRLRLQDCVRQTVKVHPQYARVLNLTYQGYSTAEICARVKVTLSNLYSILSRARRLLRHCLETGRV